MKLLSIVFFLCNLPLCLTPQIADEHQGMWSLDLIIVEDDSLSAPFSTIQEIYLQITHDKIEFSDGCNTCWSSEKPIVKDGEIRGLIVDCTERYCESNDIPPFDFNGKYEIQENNLLIDNNKYIFIFKRKEKKGR